MRKEESAFRRALHVVSNARALGRRWHAVPTFRPSLAGLALLLMLVAASLVVVACGTEPSTRGPDGTTAWVRTTTSSTPPVSDGSHIGATTVRTTKPDLEEVYVVKRTSVGNEKVFFIKQKPSNDFPGPIETSGDLTVDEEGCLRVQTSDEQPDYVLVWPREYAMSTEGGEVRIFDGEGHLKTRVGDEISVSGFSSPASGSSEEQLRRECDVPEGCRGGYYWLVGDEVDVVERG